MRKINISELHELALKNEGICLSETYEKSQTKYLWKCKIDEHPPFLASHNQIKTKNTWCPLCGKVKQVKSYSLTRKLNPIVKTEEQKQQMSIRAKELGFGKWMIGKTASIETRKKLSKILKTKYESGELVVSNERKLKISKANKGENNGMFGKTHSDETKNIIRQSAIEMWKKPEIRNRIIKFKNSEEGKIKARLGQIKAQENKKFYGTKPENEFEEILKLLGINYQKQFAVLNIDNFYCADFFIPELNLIVEIDGKYWHNYPFGTERDLIRTNEMISIGYNVLRFWEDEFSLKSVINSFSELPDYYTRLEKMEHQ